MNHRMKLGILTGLLLVLGTAVESTPQVELPQGLEEFLAKSMQDTDGIIKLIILIFLKDIAHILDTGHWSSLICKMCKML